MPSFGSVDKGNNKFDDVYSSPNPAKNLISC